MTGGKASDLRLKSAEDWVARGGDYFDALFSSTNRSYLNRRIRGKDIQAKQLRDAAEELRCRALANRETHDKSLEMAAKLDLQSEDATRKARKIETFADQHTNSLKFMKRKHSTIAGALKASLPLPCTKANKDKVKGLGATPSSTCVASERQLDGEPLLMAAQVESRPWPLDRNSLAFQGAEPLDWTSRWLDESQSTEEEHSSRSSDWTMTGGEERHHRQNRRHTNRARVRDRRREGEIDGRQALGGPLLDESSELTESTTGARAGSSRQGESAAKSIGSGQAEEWSALETRRLVTLRIDLKYGWRETLSMLTPRSEEDCINHLLLLISEGQVLPPTERSGPFADGEWRELRRLQRAGRGAKYLAVKFDRSEMQILCAWFATRRSRWQQNFTSSSVSSSVGSHRLSSKFSHRPSASSNASVTTAFNSSSCTVVGSENLDGVASDDSSITAHLRNLHTLTSVLAAVAPGQVTGWDNITSEFKRRTSCGLDDAWVRVLFMLAEQGRWPEAERLADKISRRRWKVECGFEVNGEGTLSHESFDVETLMTQGSSERSY